MTDLYKRVTRNTAGRDIIVGDVHGCFTGLREALDAIRFDDTAGDRLFFVGDLVDRGPESLDALWWLAQPWVYAVRGNHEQMLIDHAEGLSDRHMYIANGGAWALALTPPELTRFEDAFRSLPIAIELETDSGLVGIVHAASPYGVFQHLEQALETEGPRADAVINFCLWSRDRIQFGETSQITDVRAVVVGHTPMANMTSLGNTIYIDTMGWRRGHFTLLDADTLKVAKAIETA